MSDIRDSLLETALAWHRAGRGAVLATVVETWGSAPRRTGSQMIVAGDGEMAGSVSGGCVEGAVVTEATELLSEPNAPRFKVLEFGVSDDNAFAVGLACGGTIRILLEPVGIGMPPDMLADLCAARAARRAVGYRVNLETGGDQSLVGPSDFPERFQADKSGVEPDGHTFVAIHNPPTRMAIVGAVHIAQALVPMAQLAGFDVTVIDPRESFGSAARFPNIDVVDEWPDEALAAMGIDARTAVITLTHDPKLDDPALCMALASDAFYVGALGSRRTHAKRALRLEQAGLTADQIARLDAPVGLDIGAQTPAEIAVSILGGVVFSLRRGADASA